jgi:hypothetical protein
MFGWLQTYRSSHTRGGSFRAMPSQLGASSKSNKHNSPGQTRTKCFRVGNQLNPLSNHFWRLNLTWIWREIKRENLGELGVSNGGERESSRCIGVFLNEEGAREPLGGRGWGINTSVPWSQLSRGSVVPAKQHRIQRRWTCCLGWRYVAVIRWKCEHLVAHLSFCIVSPL